MSKEENKGGFIGFVLLSSKEWDINKFSKDLIEDWGINILNDINDETYEKNVIVSDVDNLKLAVSFMDVPVPNGEADYYAGANYMWQDAPSVVKTHTAQILIAVLGEGEEIEKGKLFTKAVSSALKQENALCVYTDGAVHPVDFYIGFSGMINDDELPIFNWIWFGLYRTQERAGIYTYGMHKFNKDEIEVYVDDSNADLNKIRDFTSSMVDYVLSYDVVLKDGETIGFSAEQKLAITRSDGVALEGQTIKIEYPNN